LRGRRKGKIGKIGKDRLRKDKDRGKMVEVGQEQSGAKRRKGK